MSKPDPHFSSLCKWKQIHFEVNQPINVILGTVYIPLMACAMHCNFPRLVFFIYKQNWVILDLQDCVIILCCTACESVYYNICMLNDSLLFLLHFLEPLSWLIGSSDDQERSPWVTPHFNLVGEQRFQEKAKHRGKRTKRRDIGETSLFVPLLRNSLPYFLNTLFV